jgi:S-adenosylmethionine-diacylgycerolhomoserine-N-methlytransferase
MSSIVSGLWTDLFTLGRLIRPRKARSDLEGRLEDFYSRQKHSYDHFRERLLLGRSELMSSIPINPGDFLIDMGGGTGRNLEWIGQRLSDIQSVEVVDLCESLLSVARERIAQRGWSNVSATLADVTSYVPKRGPADLITFSYSLSMIPNWFEAIDHALDLLRPGGHIGVVDFFISAKWPSPKRVKHSTFTRWFWPAWFSYTNVFLNPDHLTYLSRRCKVIQLEERLAPVPYLLGLKVPYYIFIGRKR